MYIGDDSMEVLPPTSVTEFLESSSSSTEFLETSLSSSDEESACDVEGKGCHDFRAVGKNKRSGMVGRGRGSVFRGSQQSNISGRGRGRGIDRRVGTPSVCSRSQQSSISGRGRGRGIGRRMGTPSFSSNPSVDQLDTMENSWIQEESTALTYNYEHKHGPTELLDSNLSAADLFCQFFTDEVWALLVRETNRYAGAMMKCTPSARAWYDTTVEEMKAFVGLLILMGIQKLPCLEMYWSHKYPLINTPSIASIMPRVRFEQLFRFLHLCSNSASVPSTLPGGDRLFKVRKYLDLITAEFETKYNMHQECTIDEAMIKFKGRLRFKQYMKDKPTKWGIKVFVLVDARNGYMKRLQVYTGKGVASSTNQIGLCSKLVLDLMQGFEFSGLHLYTDNYYTSPMLYNHLYNRGINTCRTARSNRKYFPTELVTSATISNRGVHKYRSNGPLLANVWIDKRSIYFLTTLHVTEPPSGTPCTVQRRQADGSVENLKCPPCLPDYQSFMRGVDRIDQLGS